jgi:hypothetical protein
MSAAPVPAPDDSSNVPDIAPGIRRSQEAYWRDLPQLLSLRSRKRLWVAYHGDERVGFDTDKAKLCQECYRRGFRADELYFGRVEPHYAPPWEPEDMDAFGEEPDEDESSVEPSP